MRPLLIVLLLSLPSLADEPIGQRPYEMDWAGRTKPHHAPTVDFEDLDGWKVDVKDAAASFERTREQQLWDKYVGKLTYRRDGDQPEVTVRPPKPIAIEAPFDCVSLWVYGNNWAWMTDKSTPRVNIDVLLKAKDGGEIALPMATVRWKEWWFIRHKLSPELVNRLAEGATFEGIRVTRGRNTEDRVLFFDNLAFYKEPLPPLSFEPRRKRNLTLPEGQTVGTNTGPGVLPFPNREETILPTNLAKNSKSTLEAKDGRYTFRYTGDDGELTYVYTPKTGRLDDVTAQWKGRDGEFSLRFTAAASGSSARTESRSSRRSSNSSNALPAPIRSRPSGRPIGKAIPPRFNTRSASGANRWSSTSNRSARTSPDSTSAESSEWRTLASFRSPTLWATGGTVPPSWSAAPRKTPSSSTRSWTTTGPIPRTTGSRTPSRRTPPTATAGRSTRPRRTASGIRASNGSSSPSPPSSKRSCRISRTTRRPGNTSRATGYGGRTASPIVTGTMRFGRKSPITG